MEVHYNYICKQSSWCTKTKYTTTKEMLPACSENMKIFPSTLLSLQKNRMAMELIWAQDLEAATESSLLNAHQLTGVMPKLMLSIPFHKVTQRNFNIFLDQKKNFPTKMVKRISLSVLVLFNIWKTRKNLKWEWKKFLEF